jgi:hypothetical protein
MLNAPRRDQRTRSRRRSEDPVKDDATYSRSWATIQVHSLMDDVLTERQGVVTRVLSNREEGLGLDVDQYMSYWVEARELPETEFSTTLVFVRSADGKIYLDGKVTDVTLLP